MVLRRVLGKQSQTSMLLATRSLPFKQQPRPYESSRVSDQSRYEDEPEPTEDEQIKSHYLKHHPFYEFKNFEEFHVDPYRHWLHGRADYLNTETYTEERNSYEKGSKVHHWVFLGFQASLMFVLTNEYRKHLRHKNIKMDIVGVFSQHHV